MIRCIEVMGEAARKTPKSLKDRHPSVPWDKMAGMRNRMIHEYFGVDVAILWKTLKEDIPTLRPLIQEITENLG